MSTTPQRRVPAPAVTGSLLAAVAGLWLLLAPFPGASDGHSQWCGPPVAIAERHPSSVCADIGWVRVHQALLALALAGLLLVAGAVWAAWDEWRRSPRRPDGKRHRPIDWNA